jgi:heme exporter protein D
VLLQFVRMQMALVQCVNRLLIVLTVIQVMNVWSTHLTLVKYALFVRMVTIIELVVKILLVVNTVTQVQHVLMKLFHVLPVQVPLKYKIALI